MTLEKVTYLFSESCAPVQKVMLLFRMLCHSSESYAYVQKVVPLSYQKVMVYHMDSIMRLLLFCFVLFVFCPVCEMGVLKNSVSFVVLKSSVSFVVTVKWFRQTRELISAQDTYTNTITKT